jgi:hypothetical protein
MERCVPSNGGEGRCMKGFSAQKRGPPPPPPRQGAAAVANLSIGSVATALRAARKARSVVASRRASLTSDIPPAELTAEDYAQATATVAGWKETKLQVPFGALLATIAKWKFGSRALRAVERLERERVIKKWARHMMVSRVQALVRGHLARGTVQELRTRCRSEEEVQE